MDIIREPRVSLIARPQFLEPAHLAVQWKGEATDGERIAEFAGRLCYMSQHNPAGRTTAEYLRNILKQGHGSVFEHSTYAMLIEGISRSCSHELVRHRAGWGYCLAGDTEIYSERRCGGRRDGPKKRTLEHLYRMTLTPHGRSRLKLLRLRCLDETSGTFTTGRVSAVACSGVKPVFKVELEDGKTITCSKEHRFLTLTGWKPLEEIVGGLEVSPGGLTMLGKAGAEILVNGLPAYKDREWLKRRYHDDRLEQTAIATLAGVSSHTIRSWVRRHKLQKPMGSWTFGRALAEIPPTAKRPIGGGHLLVPRARRITRVTYVGEQMTYDLEMTGPNHNFVANGIVTHNSQLSQRYVDESHAAFVMPPAILGDAALEAAWTEQVRAAQAAYVEAVERLMEKHAWVEDKVHRRKMAREAARSVLPNATEVKIVASANVRAWRTMLELRLGEGAELEIRRMAVACLRVLQQEAPALFADFEIYRANDGSEAGRVGFHKV